MTNETFLPQTAEDGAAPAIEPTVTDLSPSENPQDYDLMAAADNAAAPSRSAKRVGHPGAGQSTEPDVTTDYDLIMAADNAAKCIAAFDEDMTPAAMRAALTRAILNDAQGEAKLQLQAQVMDALFHRLAQRALTASGWQQKERVGYIDFQEIELALRTQSLCRATYDSLRKIKNTTEKKDSGK